jgi:tetratricopeptide (TPR) repeat protein
MSSVSSPAPRRPPWLLLSLVLLLAVSAGVSGYFVWFRQKPKPEPDMEAATAANLRGVGYMEQHTFGLAEKEFAEAVRIAPDWLPARINLGIAMFNQQPALDKTLTQHVEQAKDVFREVLKREPDNPHAHYCLGILAEYVGQRAPAYEQFVAVNTVDPLDAHTWLRVGANHPDGEYSAAARDCFEKALKLDPYLNEARYRLSMIVRETDPDRQAALLAEHDQLTRAERFTESGIKYAEMGKYADVIGRDPKLGGKPVVGPLPLFEPLPAFTVKLAAGARWAVAADLDPTRRAARERFGATMVLFDFNGDGKPDVFLLSAVVQGGAVRDLLLRNDGGGTFTDVTAEAGLATPRPSLGVAAADYDNDGYPDLVVTGAGEQHLFRNLGWGEGGGKKFEDVSAKAGLDKVSGVCLGCGWVDLDQDGDLDLVVCKYADGTAAAFDGTKAGGELLAFENVGVAPPVAKHAPAGLSTAFRPSATLAALAPKGPTVNVVASDLDADKDVDLLVLRDGAEPVVVDNDRLMRFSRRTPAWLPAGPHKWNGGLVLDANHDERSDLFLLRPEAAPVYLLSKGSREFEPTDTDSPALKQAVAVDIDMDGWTDVVGLGRDGKPVLVHNQGDGRLTTVRDAFGVLTGFGAIACADLDGDGAPDLLAWTDAGLQLHRNRGNGNAAVLLDLKGVRDTGASQRTNNDGLGAWVVAQAGTHWTGAERTTVSAGLGQSLLPTALGIGRRDRADLVRVLWPDLILQAELGVAARNPFRLAELNRKGTSCPVLMAWDGERFAFVTDFLGGGALGESGADGSTHPPRPDEAVKIEPGQLVPKDGHYVIKIAEPMDEVLYLDHLRLDVVDHPADAQVFPDERFVLAPPEPTHTILALRTRHSPRLALDHRGRDVTELVRDRDRRAVDAFACRSWLGYAEDHSLTLDCPEVPAGKWYMVLAGWTEYTYPESIYAAARAGIDLKPPALDRFDAASGKWVGVCDLGFPAGLPRVMTRGLPADFRGGKLRIATNMQVYWDQISLARAEDVETVGKVTPLAVSRADLATRGFMREVYPNGRPPVAYDDSQTEPVAVTKWKGHLTRLGDVTDLLRAADDRFVLCGPGDEITVRFDARNLPPLPAGWQRSFVLRTHGYCKDTAVTTVTGGAVGPLPFRAMPNYPDFGAVKPPATDADRWQTRPAGGR